MQDSIAQEKLIEKYLEENKKDLAVELLFDLIVKNAAAKNFLQAEQLREKLFEVDSMALHKIVKAAEIIENGKIAAIDQVHRDTWSHLYKKLTKEETIALYYGMKTASYETQQIIFRQGDMNANLYFINAGEIQMFYHKDKHGILLKTLGPGDIAGEDTFFSNSTCTTSIMVHSTVTLNFLEKSILQKWQAEAPNLISKLRNYCTQLEPVNDLLQKKELERRAYKRYPISGNVAIQITDKPQGKVFKGDLCDISASGVSFIMNASAKSAELLLGSRLNLRFSLPEAFPEIRVDQSGIIVGVHGQLFNEYLINVKWEQQIDGEILERIKLAT